MARPLVLLSNDDGYFSSGIVELRRALERSMDVVVCAPDTEQSASSHAISLNRPLRLIPRGTNIYSVDGTPADCVYVALHAGERVLPRRPDVVVSGMNHGLNLGNDVFYSGTVAAAREGALRGIPALALSASPAADLAAACELATKLVVRLHESARADGALFNVNFPPGDVWPLRATRIGSRRYEDGVLFRKDPRGGEYLWIGTGGFVHTGDEATDTNAFDSGVVGVTPLSLEMWDRGRDAAARDLVSGLGEPVD